MKKQATTNNNAQGQEQEIRDFEQPSKMTEEEYDAKYTTPRTNAQGQDKKSPTVAA